MKKQNGITLIALVISIIVMLILAGVSINAIVGENGVLSRAQYTSFMSEMAAVEEAVQLWKAGELMESKGKVDTAIPTNGLWESSKINPNTITEETKRLVGEMGYYRLWSKNGMPSDNILSLDDTLYNAYNGDFIGYPAGVQDVYYLNNEALDLDKKKVYLIDAATSMVYSTTGITLNGVKCYSSYMAKAVMGNNVAPLFAEAETTGGGSNIAYAGSTYLKDKNGNYIDENGNIVSEENKILNPNGFQIIAHMYNDNVYKLYNNGDLYGKGIKGSLLNTPQEEMESINYKKWLEFEIPRNIPGALTNDVEIISGNGTMFAIDNEGYLWAWGANTSNKLGLTKEQQVEYTGLEAIKLNVDGKKVYKVFPNAYNTFVITIAEGVYELYACGYNLYGELGIGNTEVTQEKFNKVEFSEPEKIVNITDVYGKDFSTVILKSDGKMYFSGNTGDKNANKIFQNTDLASKKITKFIEIFDGQYGQKFENKIVEMYRCYNWNSTYWMFLDENNIAYIYDYGLEKISENVEKIMCRVSDIAYMTKDENGNRKIYGKTYADGHNAFGSISPVNEFKELNSSLPFDLSEIKDIYISFECVYYLLNDGKVYFTGKAQGSGTGDVTSTYSRTLCLQEESNLPLIDHFWATNCNGMSSDCVIMIGKDNKKYATGYGDLIIRDKILQKSWRKIASNVKTFKAQTINNCLAYIDNNDDLYILGDDNTMLGIDKATTSISNFTLLKNYLQGKEIYNNIDGKVKDYFFVENAMFLVTNEEDNNTLYVCGTYTGPSWRTYNYLGITVGEDALIPKKVMDNVKMFSADGNTRIIIDYGNKMYYWGHGNGNTIPNSNVFLPTEYPENDFDGSNVKSIYLSPYTYIIASQEKHNSLFIMGGYSGPNFANGLGHSTGKKFEKFNISESVKDIVSCEGDNTYIILNENGSVYGFGEKNKLGINSIDTDLISTPQLLNGLKNITQITGGNDFFIAVTEDGKVYGTGSNKYGILGRWIGIDRNSPNSRYKTAFEWVECPELEI